MVVDSLIGLLSLLAPVKYAPVRSPEPTRYRPYGPAASSERGALRFRFEAKTFSASNLKPPTAAGSSLFPIFSFLISVVCRPSSVVLRSSFLYPFPFILDPGFGPKPTWLRPVDYMGPLHITHLIYNTFVFGFSSVVIGQQQNRQ